MAASHALKCNLNRGRSNALKSKPATIELSKVEIERRLLLSSRDICINWRGAALRTGDHVMVQRPGDGSSTVAQIIDLKDAASIPLGKSLSISRKGANGLKRMALLRLYPFASESVPPLHRGAEMCHIPYAMKEVLQSTIVEWLPVECVVNICFIFHCDLIQKGLVSCGGMERVFGVRFRQHSGKLSLLKEGQFKSFYRDPKFPFQEGVTEAIWSTLSGLKQIVSKEMSCGGIWDGRTKLARMNGVPPSFFGYLKEELEEDSEQQVQYNKLRYSRPRKHIYDNFAACQVRSLSLIHQIRVMEEWELDNVRKVCGNSFGVGLTVSVPSLRQAKLLSMPFNGTVWMRHDHQVRIVTCLPYEQDVDPSKSKRVCPDQFRTHERPSKLRCSYRGLDFRHIQNKNGTWELAVQVRFVKLPGNAPAVVKAQGVVLTGDITSDQESEDLEVREGVLIRLGSPPHLTTYIVDSIGNDGMVRCVDATDENEAPVFLTLEEAKTRYNKYIRY
jgi:hypothetical protein